MSGYEGELVITYQHDIHPSNQSQSNTTSSRTNPKINPAADQT
jgi:hypothetical protein